MRRKSFAGMSCSVAASLEEVGDWWTLLIVRDALLGLRRFEDFRESLGIARNILSNRLERLVRSGILERRTYQEHPPRKEYRLTEKGRDLLPVIVTLTRWGDRWLWPPGQQPFLLIHQDCGQETKAKLVCQECGGDVTARNTRRMPSPGLDLSRLNAVQLRLVR